MSVNCGKLKKATNPAPGAPDWIGEVNLARRLNGKLQLYKNPRWKQTPDSSIPTHLVGYTPEYRDGTQREMLIGNAWTKYAEKQQSDFLTLTLDDPDWPNAINLAAFSREDGSLDLVWSRPRQTEERKAA